MVVAEAEHSKCTVSCKKSTSITLRPRQKKAQNRKTPTSRKLEKNGWKIEKSNSLTIVSYFSYFGPIVLQFFSDFGFVFYL